MKKKTKNIIFVLAVLIVLAIAVYALVKTQSAVLELAQFNAKSSTEWQLGGEIEGVDSINDAKSFSPDKYKFVTDSNGDALVNRQSGARCYIAADGIKIKVVGISVTDNESEILGIRVGDNAQDAQTKLLDLGYKLRSAGYNKCRLVNDDIAVYLEFEHSEITGIAAYIE